MPAEHGPNVLYVFADQLRAQATGFGGDPNARAYARSYALPHTARDDPASC